MKYKIVYTDNLPNGVGGRCEYPSIPFFGLGTCIIKIRPKYKNDKGILNHELKHVYQYNAHPLHTTLYNNSKDYRYKCELDAYAEQIREYKYAHITQCEWIVEAILNKYDLHFNTDNIIRDISKILKEVSNV